MNIVVSYNGIDPDLYETIREIAPNNESGSGYSFVDGRRDLSFSFKTTKDFKHSLKRFKNLAKEKRSQSITVEVYE